MDNVKKRNLRLYHNTMALMRKMLEKGVISEEEYAIIDTNIANKYSLSLSIIYR